MRQAKAQKPKETPKEKKERKRDFQESRQQVITGLTCVFSEVFIMDKTIFLIALISSISIMVNIFLVGQDSGLARNNLSLV